MDCPNCGAELLIDDTVVESGIVTCPECGSEYAVSFDEDECECGCCDCGEGCCEEE